ncbi:hypothetical protein PGT21_016690 [Puccinia graminis f. sp. tritici]|uniref:Uncharacterized protein n=2 Tax=Puccinia graminis f. sp. tritici TaxID=56615 RepID=E3KEJ0_PUCGT|nr:uncharacterized protein PGTG_08753 [Puccinia graminis f. sp. tritici CRL 75-36-700-3]EFP82557.1 hypothetical protein PGTG_08753 [Puccinia graminis f. sp. tritici CRL 75-36-700-3]KAA1070581.1 hypothetical protein PGT21_016690 [Puccinia graminis f. sp. tritici]KAA1089822.1 hypothetical protein PGTUg99_019774 [Puccinia graminis f. sp. tritici]
MPENSRGSGDESLFGTPAIDQAVSGIGAGCISVLCMHPLDLLKVKLQVSSKPLLANHISLHATTSAPSLVHSKSLSSLHQIIRNDGFFGLYRGLTPNIVGNAASWGFYFMWYSMIKDRMSTDSEGRNIKLSASQHLFASASSGIMTAMITNPLWVVKTRMFTSRAEDSGAYKNLWDGLVRISKEEGLGGLWKGSVLALIGVSNGAIQFMTYEELKRWRQDLIRPDPQRSLNSTETEILPLSNLEYILLSGASKLLAIGITYPYQVVRSRLQNQLFVRQSKGLNSSTQSVRPSNSIPIPSPLTPSTGDVHYRSIAHCILHTYRTEGIKAFYKGLAVNAVRVLPGTCVAFLVYENLSNSFKKLAHQKNLP